MKRVHVIICGDVQGVGYRYTMRMIAADAGVSGWVRNRRDGTVEAEVEGTPPRSTRCSPGWRRDRPVARVDTAQVTDAAPTGERGFEVRRDA